MSTEERRHQAVSGDSATVLAEAPSPSTVARLKTLDRYHFFAGDLLADRFEIVRWIASGGMGDVYEALDMELGERVAVKAIKHEISSDQLAMDRFRREISLARKVTHPSVCRIFDVFFHSANDVTSDARGSGDSVEPSIAFLTMELLNGATLSEHLKAGGPMPTDEAWPLVRQMASALASAHEAGVVHRDFKCGNVLLVGGSNGIRAVVTDFGLARHVELGDGELTTTGEIVGSPAYMAPEQATGGKITPAADIYALGIVMYEMVTGRLPFEAASPLAALVKRAKEPPRSPRIYVEDLDPRWEAAIMKCLARDPAKRFATADDVIAELSPSTRSRPPQGNRRRRWLEAILVLLVVLAGVTHLPIFQRTPESVAAMPAPSAEARQSVAVLGFKNLTGRPTAAWLSTALAELLATELALGDGLRTVPGENVARMKIELAVKETDGLAADTLLAIGDHLNTDAVVLGSYLATGDGGPLRLDLRLQDTASGETIATLSETAAEAELLDLVSRLGSGLRRELGHEELSVDQQAAKRASMPANPAAARFFAQGLAGLRAFDALAARDYLQQAVDADPGYAVAYAALAEAWSTLGYDTEAMDQISIAFELGTALPRQERLLIEGQYLEVAADWDRAIEIYRTLYELYPDELEYGLDLARSQTRGNRPQEASATLEALRQLPPPAGDDPRIDLQEANLAWSLAQYPRVYEAASRAETKGQRLSARLLAARARWLVGRALWRMGRLDEAMAAARESEQALFELGDRAAGALALNLRGIVLYERGELDAALSVYDEALAVFREIGHRRGIGDVLTNQAIIFHVQGELDQAAELHQETLRMAREVGDKTNVSIGLYNLALLHRQQGQASTAKGMLEEALAIARELENPYLLASRLIGMAGILGAEGDVAQARRKYTEASQIMRQLDNRDGVAFTVYQLGLLDLVSGDLKSSRRRLEEALAIQEELGAEGRALHARLALARLDLEEGEYQLAVDQARDIAQGFAAARRPVDEARAYAVLARAELLGDRLPAAREARDRALVLIGSTDDVSLKVEVSILAAQLAAAEGRPDEALTVLETARAKAAAADLFGRQLEARLAAGEIELRAGRGEGGRARLAAVESDATARGFVRVARKARQLSERG